jgi:type I restriction enzyme M protein
MSYMSASSCNWGVWHNGDEIEYIYKNLANGEIKREFIFQIPSKGQTFEDIGRLSKDSLKPAKNLKPIFKRILNVLYANTNISRREKLGSEMIRLLFCKIWDEKYDQDKPPKFMIRVNEKPEAVKERVEWLFGEVRKELAEDGVFDENERILIDPKSIAYVVGELEQYSLTNTDKDIVGDAFEVFAESKFVGEKGEFFTPREVVKMCVRMIDPEPKKKVFDPACGSGGFLIYALEHVWEKMDRDPHYRGSNLAEEKKNIAEKYFSGIDKEIDLVKIAKAYMAIVGDGRGGIVQENSLHNYQDWNDRAKLLFTNNGNSTKKVEVILTNPPFGAKIKIQENEVLEQFDLGHKWKFDKDAQKWVKTAETQKTEPQLLFIERCMDFLAEDGKMAIVLPDGVFGNPTDGWVRQWIKERAEILAIIDCPPDTFMPHTHTKTSVLFLRKYKRNEHKENYPIFCSVVKKCGHDARGNDIRKADGSLDEEFSDAATKFLANPSRIINGWERKGFTLYERKLRKDILIPRYYNPETITLLEELRRSGKYEMKSIAKLIEEGTIKIKGAGTTVNPQDYDTGDIPFIRTSEISNWEINSDATHKVARDLYVGFKERQNLKKDDILFVKDGTFLIGDTAVITEYDLEIVVQSHFLVIRVLDKEKLDPYLLFHLLNSPIVKRQIDEKTFVQATLSTIGDRLEEVILPIPKDEKVAKQMAETTKKIILIRAELRHQLKTMF